MTKSNTSSAYNVNSKRKFSFANLCISIIILLLTLACLLPMVLSLMVSITDETSIMRNGYSFFPKAFSLYAYQLIFRSGSNVINGYVISLFVTIVGTLLAVLFTSAAAYTLANKNVAYRNILGAIFFYPNDFWHRYRSLVLNMQAVWINQ